MASSKPTSRNPWTWVPSLYVAEGIPYTMAMTVSVVLYKRLGISNTDIALYTSWLYLPWVIKPLWSPLVDLFRTKRYWILLTQLLIGASLASVALTIPASRFFQYTLALFWLMAFSSATHDIAADGFYMLGLREHDQAAFVGVRTTFYRISMIATQGGLVILAGFLEGKGYAIPIAWAIALFVAACVFWVLFLYHSFILPYPASDTSARRTPSTSFTKEFFHTFYLFFKKKGILTILAFLLFYRFAETQIVKIIAPFLLDPRSSGGLGLTTSEVGITYGTVGVVSLMIGGLLGGYAIYRKGLKFWIWGMVCAVHLPDLVYVYLSQALPHNLYLINLCVALEQFGYGFGFTAYTLFMIMISEGEYKTVHYAIATGIMALGMMIPAMFSGWLQEQMGYPNFFLWVMVATIPGFIVTGLVKIDPEFGKKKKMG
ncbi:MAG: AmpG family muropeptide MFS transporter [Deltaproteobacteria bacterium]|nr:AmpG family muropeptide MFS transporter [Deltaproteobacteria bacterium]MBM4322464.1 AmpG family muropeptide MFS transporter [Deltaproteobacteria bacterium]MBM4347595.1 AmpG family muropeptide MFS transporter [Deltaproteobacteria bacterium]